MLTLSVIAYSFGSAKFQSYETLVSTHDSRVQNAVNYLTNIMFVPNIGLLKEAPKAAPNTIWLTNDNLLAYAVLSELNNPMATTLKESLDQYGVNGNGLVEVLLNQTIDPIRGSNSHNITIVEQYTIKEDVRDGGIMEDFNQYADLCFWWSQNLLLKYDVNGAIASFNRGMSMWNGTGFSDKLFNGTEYQTYKIGLALWMAERLNYTTNGQLFIQTSFTDADYTEMQNILWTLQDPTNGGIHTGYSSTSGTISSNTDTNVETTSICLLYQLVPAPALQHSSPTPIPELSLPTLLIASIVGGSAVVLYKRKFKLRIVNLS